MLGAYVIVLLFFAYMFFMNSGGQRVEIILYKWINRKRIFAGTIKGIIKKRYKDNTEEMLNFKANKKSLWSHVPDNEFFLTNLKGIYTLHAVIDANNNISFIKPDDTIYQKEVKKFTEPLLDKNGKNIFDEVYILDENNELILEPMKENGKFVYDKETNEQIFIPKIEKKMKMHIKEKEIETPSSYDHIIESDRKLYYLNKKEEIRQKFKREESKSLWQTIAPIAMIGIIVIATVYLSYKHIKQIGDDFANERKSFLVQLANTIREDPSKINPLNNDKPENYGQEAGGG